METDELAQHLESLQRESCYRVDAVLKQSAVEETQRVFFVGANGAESGPFIRKFIKRGFGMGGAYERIFQAQRDGRRFKYIPDILECYTRDDSLAVVMECVRGRTLQDEVYECDPSLELALRVFPLLCDAVSELHREFDPPIIHRDLKPSNVILTGQGLALIDFGISRAFREGAEEDTSHFGTRSFAPPEQYGFGQTTAASDVYSLGMVLYYCLTETIPDAKTRERGFRDERIPEGVRQVIAQAGALDPAERFKSAAALKQAFLHMAQEASAEAGNIPTTRETARTHAPIPAATVRPAGNTDDARCAQAAGSEDATVNGTAGASQVPGKPKAKRSGGLKGALIGIAALLVVCVAAFSLSGMLGGAAEGGGEQASDQPAQTPDSTDQDAADNPKVSGPMKNGFDEQTNFTVIIGDLEFQIPRYFKERSNQSGKTAVHNYYAETGSSVAMIMTSEDEVGAISEDDDVDELFDSYIAGMFDAANLKNLISSTTFDLSGHTARIFIFNGEIANKPIVGKATVFIIPESESVGLIALAQSADAQFDYSEDFAKVVTSAQPAGQ